MRWGAREAFNRFRYYAGRAYPVNADNRGHLARRPEAQAQAAGAWLPGAHGEEPCHGIFPFAKMRYNDFMTTPDPILTKFRAALTELYGDRIERVVLFGSRARGDAREDSDYDVALFLKDLPDKWAEIDRLVELQVTMLETTGADIHTMPFPAGTWAKRTPLMHEIRKDGLVL